MITKKDTDKKKATSRVTKTTAKKTSIKTTKATKVTKENKVEKPVKETKLTRVAKTTTETKPETIRKPKATVEKTTTPRVKKGKQIENTVKDIIIKEPASSRLQSGLVQFTTPYVLNDEEPIIVKDKDKPEKPSVKELNDKQRKERNELRIQQYGIQRMLDRYYKDKISIYKLSLETGVGEEFLKEYLDKRECDIEYDSGEVDYRDYNIEKDCYDHKYMRMMHLMEVYVDNTIDKCKSCAYRNCSNNRCWYTVATGAPLFSSAGNTCEHYVDVRRLPSDKRYCTKQAKQG